MKAIGPRTFELLLATTPGVGGRTITRILARNGLLSRSAAQFLALSPEALQEEYRLPLKVVAQLKLAPKEAISEVLALEARLDGLGVQLVTIADARYPSLVEAMDPDPPGVLFLYGNQRLLDARTFAIMSSRGTTPGELDQMERWTEWAVLRGEIVVSGHDRPEYQRTALVPLRWGAPRILCLDRGLFPVLGDDLRNEAFRAARLWRYEFDPKTDLVVSPFKPDTGFHGHNNQIRDKLVACLARRLDFMHLSEGGNMEKIANLAIKAGRPVRVSPLSKSAQGLLSGGAVPLPDEPDRIE